MESKVFFFSWLMCHIIPLLLSMISTCAAEAPPEFTEFFKVPSGENMSLSCRLVVSSANVVSSVLTTRLQQTATGLETLETETTSLEYEHGCGSRLLDAQNRSTNIIQY